MVDNQQYMAQYYKYASKQVKPKTKYYGSHSILHRILLLIYVWSNNGNRTRIQR